MPIPRPVLRVLVATVPMLLLGVLLPPASATAVDEPVAAGALGTITGTLTVEDTGSPLGTGEVVLWRNEGGDETPDFAALETVAADAAGRYEIVAAPGRYRLRFVDTTGQNTAEFHQDAVSVEQGRDVVVRDGETTTVDGALAQKGSVVGRITGEEDEPLPDVEVRLWENRGLPEFPEWEQAEDTVVTDADGRYRVYAEPGPYRVQFVDPDSNPGPRHATEWFRNAPDLDRADDVLLGTGALTADARLTTRGTVAGTVTGDDGPALAGLDVTLYVTPDRGATWTPALTTTTDASGSYEFLTAPDTYRLGFADPTEEYYPEFHDDAETVDAGDDVEVGLEIADVDAVLARQPDPLTNLTPPSVDGTPLVGETLGARPGTWDPQPEVTRYQWYADGARIPGATGALFQPGPEHRGDRVAVEVTVEATDFLDTTLRSETVGPVRQRYEATTAPSVVGTPEVGETLTGLTGTFSPSPAGFTYRWLADGEPIPGATGSGLTLAEDQRGARVSFEVTAPDDGDFVETSVRSAQVGPVTQRIKNSALPTVSGTAAVGSTVSAEPGTWSPDPTSYAHQWYADGVAITNATGPTFSPTSAQRGDELTVEVTARRDGYTPTTRTSVAVGPVTEALRPTTPPIVTGTPRVGRTLTVNVGAWSSQPDGYRYQWYADDVAIAGATGPQHVLTASERGTAITVDVTALGSGEWTTTTVRTAATGVVSQQLAATTPPSVEGNPVVGQRLTAREGTWSGPVTSYRYQWYADDVAVARATGRTLDLTDAQRGAAVHVVVTAVGSGTWVDGNAPSAATTRVTQVLTSTSAPRVTGDPLVGRTLTAQPGSWSPSWTVFSYRWFADGEPLDGATTRTLRLTSEHRGAAITVAVTAVGSGYYTDGTATTGPTARVTEERTVVSAPTVTGEPRVGSTLTADEGEWTPEPDGYTYQWYADDDEIVGATARTFVPTADQRGTRISVDVTADGGDGWAATPATSAEVGPVTERIANRVPPTVTGDPAVGSTLTAATGTWSTTPTAFRYQWYADDVAVPGATGPTFVPTDEDRGARIRVEVTAVGDGTWTDSDALRSAPVGPVTQPVVNTGAPRIDGTPRVGSPLTATSGGWTPTPEGLAYRWFAGETEIEGATGSTYTATAAERGALITVEVTASADGYRETSVRSAAVGPVTQTVRSTTAPTVVGTPQLGQTLTAKPGSWSPRPTGYRYQWYADGAKVAGATRATLAPTAQELGEALTVRVTPTGPNLVGTGVVSAPTAEVTAVPTVRLTGAVKGSKLILTVAVTVPGLASVPGKVTVTAAGTKLGTVTLRKGRGTLTVARPRQATTFVASYLGSGPLLKARGSLRTR